MVSGTVFRTPHVMPEHARRAADDAAQAVRLRSALVLCGRADRVPARPTATPPFAVLSGREREVVALIADGLGTKDVAARLFVSVKTIETHRQHVLAKLRVSGVAGLTKDAVREGLTPLDG